MVGATVKRVGNMRMVGRVVSDLMQRTVVVRVDHKVWHTKYRRFFLRRKRFFAHDHGARSLPMPAFFQFHLLGVQSSSSISLYAMLPYFLVSSPKN